MDEVPQSLDESNWTYMLKKTYQIYDRQDYLREMHLDLLNQEQVRKASEEQKKVSRLFFFIKMNFSCTMND